MLIVILNNLLIDQGGSIYINNSNITTYNSQFYNNSAPSGGAIFLINSNIQIYLTIFSNNNAKGI